MTQPDFPPQLQYTSDHEWISLDETIATVGITHFAASALGDIVFVELPTVGQAVTVGHACGEIESTKSVSDLFPPATGTVVEVNENVVNDPGLVNASPYSDGWLFKVEVTGDFAALDAIAYATLVSGE